MGNFIVSFGSGIVNYESIVFKQFNYIDPIYNRLKLIESILSDIGLNIGTPTFHSNPSNVNSNKVSSGKHLGSYFARKRCRRQQQIISGSNQSKNDSSNDDAHTNALPGFHCMETYDNDFHPMDDPSCQDNIWYDAISPYWTGGMIWDSAYVLNHQVVSVTIDPIFVSNLPPALLNCLPQFKHRKQGVGTRMSAHGPPLLLIVDLVFTYSKMLFF
jgi:hypothetical protein